MIAPLLPIVVAISLRLPGAPAPRVEHQARARPPQSADPWVGPDKVKHFFVSALAQSVGYASLRALRAEHGVALVGASAGTLALGVGREVFDRGAGRTFSPRDLVWDAAGAGAASVLLAQTVR